MNSFAATTFAERDIETLGLSLAMCEQGVDIIRVHDPLSHIRAYRAWAQVRA
jgi:dihydropteroate synthase